MTNPQPKPAPLPDALRELIALLARAAVDNHFNGNNQSEKNDRQIT